MSTEHLAEQAKKFSRYAVSTTEARSKDRRDGAEIFLQLDDQDRLGLIAAMIQAWTEKLPLNRAMISGALRLGWDTEPYLDGVRIGSYVSNVAALTPGGADWTMGDFAADWGPDLMTTEEANRLEAMEFPLTVYRGGTGSFDEVAVGISWSISLETASFYANTWPKRWGDARRPIILTTTVTRTDVAALLDDRKEAELLIPRSADRRTTVRFLKAKLKPVAAA